MSLRRGCQGRSARRRELVVRMMLAGLTLLLWGCGSRSDLYGALQEDADDRFVGTGGALPGLVGTGGSSSDLGTGGGTGGEIDVDEELDPEPLPKYVAVYLFVSSTSTTSALFLYERDDPSQPPRIVEPTRQLGSLFWFSPDGQRLLFSTKTMVGGTMGIALTSIAAVETGVEPVPLFDEVSTSSSCDWNPTSDHLVCAVAAGGDTFEVFGFSVGESVSPATKIGDASRVYGFRDNGRYFFASATDGTLLSTEEEAELPSEHLASEVAAVNPAGNRAFGPEQMAPEVTLFDLTADSQGSLSGDQVVVSDSQGYAAVTEYDDLEGHYREEHYYLGDVTAPKLVSVDEYVSFDSGNPLTYRDFFRDGVRVRRRDGDLQVDFLLPTGGTRSTVPLLEGEVAVYLLAPDQRSLFIETRPSEDAPSGESSRYYLARLTDTSVDAVEEIAAGFAATPRFSPTSRRLLLSNPKEAPDMGEFRLVDTASSDPLQVTSFELPLYWAQISWSRDGSHVGFLGGNEIDGQRELYVVDVFQQNPTGTLVVHCPPSSESEPACPSSAKFQP